MTKILKGFLLVVLMVSFISCGSQAPAVKNVKVSTQTVDNDVFVSLSADLVIGSLQLPYASFPIVLPRTGREIGQVSLGANSDGSNKVTLDANISELANLQLSAVRLPNGTLLPIIADNDVLRIPAGKVEVYLSLLDGAQAIGVAIPIKTFDQIGARVGTSTLMPIFNSNNIIGAAGVYTSPEAGKNGFALIADISEVINVSIPNAFAKQAQSSLDYKSVMPSKAQERKINRELYKLHRKRKVLELN